MFACVPAADHEGRIAFVHHILVSAVGKLGSVSAAELRDSASAGWTSPARFMYRTMILYIVALCCEASGYKCSTGWSVSSSAWSGSSSVL